MKLLKSRRKLLRSKRAAVETPTVNEDQFRLCSEYFDLAYYLKVSGDSPFTQKTGLEHYLNSGWREGLDPSAEFSTQGYLDLYPDVAEAGINPLLHYVLHGRFENRHIQRADGGFTGKIERLTDDGIRGWVVNEHNPAMILPIKVIINGQHYVTIHNDRSRPDLRRLGLSEGAGGFQLSIPFDRLEPDTYKVAVEFPDGTRLEAARTITTSALALHSVVPVSLSLERKAALKVVVPIYNAIEDVKVCIARLREHTPVGVEVILIDDASSDPAIAEELEKLAGEGLFHVLRNEENLGFTKTVNRGIAEAGDADVIILNSDARVTHRWIEGMDAAARSRPKVATVTAMSDRAGAFSAPNIGNDNPLPAGVSEEDFARAFRRRSLRLYPEVPTGNGFCMLIRRKALDELGGLDADAFPRGYGEENDFCMRAMRAGWTNVIDDATYVFHDRSKSFGAEKDDNIIKGRAVVDQRYPEYKLLTRVFQTGSSIVMARFRARMALADCTNGRGILPRALFVLATRTGGTPQTNADLMGAVSDSFECYVLVCDSNTLELSVYEDGESKVLKTHQLHEPIEPLTHTSSEYDDIVSQWMGALDLTIVHIRHLGWHSLNLPALARQTGARVVMSFHDYYALSPSLKLLDDENVFCGNTYTEAGSHRTIEIWPGRSLPTLSEDWIGHWRERMGRALDHCDSFVTTSQSAKDRIAEAFPNIPADHFHVIPHGRDFAEFKNLQHLPDGVSPVRILVPGNIDRAKGMNLIAALIDIDRLGVFEFHILGMADTKDLSEAQIKRLHFHGRYNRADFAEKVRSIAPNFGVVLSVWDETYCHTLTEMWSVGLPVAVLDFPNIRNRMEKSGAGWIIEGIEPAAVYCSLKRIATDRDELIAKGAATVRWQFERGRAQSCRQMASRYLDVYSGATIEAGKPKIAVTSPANKNLSRANASTQIRVWERTRNALDRPNTFIRSDAASLIAKMKLGMIDAAIVQRTAIPSVLVNEFLATASATNTPFLFELDDQLLSVPPSKDSNGFYSAYSDHLKELLAAAAGVIVSTKPLLNEIRELNDNVVCLENRISERLWAGGRVPSRSSKLQLLYFGSRTHEEDLTFALDALTIARKTIPGIELTVIGISEREALPEWVRLASVPDECKSYTSFVPWLREQTMDIVLGIAPLLDINFNRYKSDLKVLEYGALGLPVIASDVESFRNLGSEPLSRGLSLVPNTPAQWAKEFVIRLERPEELRDAGLELQRWVFSKRSLHGDLDRFDSIVSQIL